MTFEDTLRFKQPGLVPGFWVEVDRYNFGVLAAAEEDVALGVVGDTLTAVHCVGLNRFRLSKVLVSDLKLLGFHRGYVEYPIDGSRDDVLLVVCKFARSDHRLRLFVPEERNCALAHVVSTDSHVASASRHHC